MNAVDRNHPEIAQLIVDHIHQRPGHHKPYEKMSDQSLLLDSMECMKILHDRKIQQQAQSTMKSFFSTSTPVIAKQKHIGSIGLINSFNSEKIKCGNFLDLEEPNALIDLTDIINQTEISMIKNGEFFGQTFNLYLLYNTMSN